ncbi:MAG: HD-GYP domain-containing protein [Bacillota bacterium]
MLCGTLDHQFLLTNDDLNVLEIAAKQIVMALERIKRDKLNLYNQMQVKFQKEMIHAMINMLEIHDEYTKGHSENVAQLAVQVAYELGLDFSDINDAYWAGKIHDIGKTLVPTKILNKEDKLTDKEYQKIKNHPTWGYQALQNLDQLDKIANYIYYHHERCDGHGYPNGVKEEEIPLISKILTVVDAWDAMRSQRSYREPLSQQAAINELQDNKGTQFAPEVVDAFLNIVA